MSKGFNYILILFLGLTLGFYAPVLITYLNNTTENSPPGNIPITSRWAGGSDGGVWVDCKEQAAHSFKCTIYADVTGVIIEDGIYELNAEMKQPTFYTSGLITMDMTLKKKSPTKQMPNTE